MKLLSLRRKYMTSWLDSSLEMVNDWAQIVGLLALIITLVSAWGLYATGKEIARRGKMRESDATAAKKEMQKTLDATISDLDKAKSSLEQTQKLARELELKQRKRTLSPEQRQLLASCLKTMLPASITIFAILGDSDGISYGNEFKSVFQECGWSVAGVDQSVITPVAPNGLWISVHSSETVPSWTNDLIRCLRNAGFNVEGRADPGIPEGQLHLLIGTKGETAK
jgi:hypothetical protein